MDQRNFAFLFYGFLAAWLIVLFYVVSLIRRSSRLKKELDDVKQLLDDRPSNQSVKTRTY
ncbi:MAG: CcmD family protein [Bryobacteraceae bacterium]